jgi:malate dehydrogenase (oxaloacetate-decarboxylating)
MPLCLNVSSPEQFCDVVCALEPTFGGINMEDVAAPHCFRIVEDLEKRLSIPIIHDDQFGTATVIIAGLLNALKLTGRTIENARVVVNGIGAAGTATIRLLEELGAAEITAVDRPGILVKSARYPHSHWQDIAERTNGQLVKGDLAAAIRGADIFIGLSVGGIVSEAMVRSMARDAIVFGLANPEPEISPDRALSAGAAIAASGRFDFPNHCNNVLAFPGLMRAALDTKAIRVSRGMCIAAARSLAGLAGSSARELLPSPLDLVAHASVAEAAAMAAVEEGLARIQVQSGAVRHGTLERAKIVAKRQSGGYRL